MSSTTRPLHPSLVHFPLTFLLSASLIDLLTHASKSYQSAVAPFANILSISVTSLVQYTTLFSYVLTIVAVVTAIPAVLSGIAQASVLVNSKGFEARSAKMMQLHALIMDVSIVGTAYNWYTRKRAEGHMSSGINGIVSAAVFGLVAFSGFIGGRLVFEHGVGVSRIGKEKKKL